jgi:tetratricopeptide (TPR) repeat protein
MKKKLARLDGLAGSSKEEADGLKEQLADLELERYRQVEEIRKGAREEADSLKEQLAALELESRRQLEGIRKEADATIGTLKERLAHLEKGEREQLAERERLERTVVEMERRRNEAEGWYRQAYQAEKVSREALGQARLELAEQSLELGKVNMGRRGWDKARLYFLKALEIDPRNREAYYSLGEVYFQLGRFDLSKEMYERAGK